MSNIAGYPSAVIKGTPGKSGRIQGVEAAPAPFSPLDISNIIGWWDAALGITLNGADVSQWDDQSTNANDLIQTQSMAPSRQPLYINPGGVPPSISFNGTTDSMRTVTFKVGGVRSQPNTIMMVAQKNGAGSADQIMDGITSGQRHLASAAGGNFSINSGATLFSTTAMDLVKRILVYIFDSDIGSPDSRIYLSGGAAIASGNSGTQLWGGLSIGARFQDDIFADFDYWEIAAYERRLTPSEVNQLGQYLSVKHSVGWTDIT